jgi:predicted transcriptional regulator
MKTLSLKLDEILFQQTENILSKLNKPRNRYINEALAYYNKVQNRKLIEKKLALESDLVGDESMKVLGEFEAFESNED